MNNLKSAVAYMAFSLGNFSFSEIFDLWLTLAYHISMYFSFSLFYLDICNGLCTCTVTKLTIPQVSPIPITRCLYIQFPRGTV